MSQSRSRRDGIYLRCNPPPPVAVGSIGSESGPAHEVDPVVVNALFLFPSPPPPSAAAARTEEDDGCGRAST